MLLFWPDIFRNYNGGVLIIFTTGNNNVKPTSIQTLNKMRSRVLVYNGHIKRDLAAYTIYTKQYITMFAMYLEKSGS